VIVAHWGWRWPGVALCLIVAKSGPVVFDGEWVPLGLLLGYDVMRTLATANKGPVQT
jgi:hypothetical protein